MESESEEQLWECWSRSRSLEARNLLVKKYLWLAEEWANWAAGKLWRRGKDIQSDLEQEARVLLILGVEHFDPTRGVPFPIYAKQWLRNAWTCDEVTRGLPRSQRELVRRVVRAHDELMYELQRKPTMPEIANRAGCSVRNVEVAIRFIEQGRPSSLSDPDGGMQDVRDDRAEDPVDHVVRTDTVEQVRTALEALPDERARDVLRDYYSEEDSPSVSDIASKRKLTDTNVKQILHRGRKRLRQDKALHEYGN